MKRMTTRERNRLDDEIERIVRTDCHGVQISILDIGKVFKAAYAAHEAGANVRDAVVSTYHELSQGRVSRATL